MSCVCEDVSSSSGLVADMLYVALAKSFHPPISKFAFEKQTEIIFCILKLSRGSDKESK